MIKYKIKEIIKGIFLVEFDNRFDLAMTFLRYQEYYESANPKFKGKQFTIMDYIEWYSKNNNNIFTYADDWVGFNIPFNIIYEVQHNISKIGSILDRNKYDDLMEKIVSKCDYRVGNYDENLYLIGAYKGEISIIKHEIAHGLYTVNTEYKERMNKLYSELSPISKKALEKEFLDLGYHKSVWKDEAQAFLSTGTDCLTSIERKPFIKTFKEYTKNIKLN